MSSDHRPNGLANIRKAIKAELRRCAIKDWSIDDNSEEVGRISAVTFTVTAQGQRATKEFSRAEIENSYLAIIPEVGTKIREFVDGFARQINRSTSS